MFVRPFRTADQPALLSLTIATFGPFFEESFRSIVGDEIMLNQHADWQTAYRRTWTDLHDPANHRYVAVAEDDSTLLGFVAWQTDHERHNAKIEILAVDAAYRRHGIGTRLSEYAFAAMRDQGATVVSLGTGGDTFHDAARALYERLGMIALPLVVYYRQL
ncbi:MAG: GNAT family N-acetyltransferase [Kribbellaceae bacterium]|nr:GNAT family N-acetyltransferase [Kribbellaceae bacterium]